MFDFIALISYNEAEIKMDTGGCGMDKLEKLALLGESAKYDVCASSSATPKKFKNADIGRTIPSGAYHSLKS